MKKLTVHFSMVNGEKISKEHENPEAISIFQESIMKGECKFVLVGGTLINLNNVNTIDFTETKTSLQSKSVSIEDLDKIVF